MKISMKKNRLTDIQNRLAVAGWREGGSLELVDAKYYIKDD